MRFELCEITIDNHIASGPDGLGSIEDTIQIV